MSNFLQVKAITVHRAYSLSQLTVNTPKHSITQNTSFAPWHRTFAFWCILILVKG